MFHIGIDPGLNGGIAILQDSGFYMAYKMPLRTDDTVNSLAVYDILSRLSRSGGIYVCLEKAQSAPRQGLSSTFNYGMGYGKIRAVLEVLGFHHRLIRPQEWKKHLGLSSQPGKDAAIAFVKEWYPDCQLVQPGCRKPHDGIADAMCLAVYCRETHGRSRS